MLADLPAQVELDKLEFGVTGSAHSNLVTCSPVGSFPARQFATASAEASVETASLEASLHADALSGSATALHLPIRSDRVGHPSSQQPREQQ
eukprot:2113230-Amphidinium_carterae.1